ncbi:hypothetical protein J437_LFUL018224 [Ladona fulva]|uniref:Reverse transcriptase domain-containing protein n=1 Tax=Ladona fulva TaxID=123851 RepID=A0A8K0PC29_LADFU|nr:hypothetical protein J437_LFUL018224 [Ladona fulva]
MKYIKRKHTLGGSCITAIENLSLGPYIPTATVIAFPLSEIFNLSIQKGIFPTAFKTAIIIPIHKKSSLNTSYNYRPISILSAFSKIFENLFNIRVTNCLNHFGKLSKSQHGFGEAHSMIFLIQYPKVIHSCYTKIPTRKAQRRKEKRSQRAGLDWSLANSFELHECQASLTAFQVNMFIQLILVSLETIHPGMAEMRLPDNGDFWSGDYHIIHTIEKRRGQGGVYLRSWEGELNVTCNAMGGYCNSTSVHAYFNRNFLSAAKRVIGREKNMSKKGMEEGQRMYGQLRNKINRTAKLAKESFLQVSCKEVEEHMENGRFELAYKTIKNFFGKHKKPGNAKKKAILLLYLGKKMLENLYVSLRRRQTTQRRTQKKDYNVQDPNCSTNRVRSVSRHKLQVKLGTVVTPITEGFPIDRWFECSCGYGDEWLLGLSSSSSEEELRGAW